MIRLRKTLAVVALAALGGLIVTLERGAYGVNPGLVVATRVLLLPLGITVIGLLLDKYWGRWLALAAAVAVLPWALVLTFGLPPGAPLTQQRIALLAAVLLLVSLLGRNMFERYEGHAPTDWSGSEKLVASSSPVSLGLPSPSGSGSVPLSDRSVVTATPPGVAAVVTVTWLA